MFIILVYVPFSFSQKLGFSIHEGQCLEFRNIIPGFFETIKFIHAREIISE